MYEKYLNSSVFSDKQIKTRYNFLPTQLGNTLKWFKWKYPVLVRMQKMGTLTHCFLEGKLIL